MYSNGKRAKLSIGEYFVMTLINPIPFFSQDDQWCVAASFQSLMKIGLGTKKKNDQVCQISKSLQILSLSCVSQYLFTFNLCCHTIVVDPYPNRSS